MYTGARSTTFCGLGMAGALALALFLITGAPLGGIASGPPAADVAVSVDEPQHGATFPLSYNAWTPRAAMPTGRNSPGSAVLGGEVFVIGGWGESSTLTTVEAYDPLADSWLPVADMLTSRNALGAAALGGKVYAVGGWSSATMAVTAAVEAYDPVADAWVPVSPLPHARNALGVVAARGRIFALGGWDGKTVTNTVTAYDPASDSWSLCARMPTARNGLAAVAIGDMIYAIGGTDGTAVTGAVEIYNAATDSWTTGAAMPTARWNMGAAVIGGKIYVVGGNPTGDYGPALSANEEYDPVANAWRAVAAMPTALWGMGVDAVAGRLYAIGGSYPSTGNLMYEPPAPHTLFLPGVLHSASPGQPTVSRPRFQVFILNPVRTCLVGNDFASGDVCRGTNCGDCDCTWQEFDPPAPLVGVDPEHVNDPQYDTFKYKVCVEVRLTQAEVDKIIADMQLVREEVLAWSGGALDLQMQFTVLPHDHVGFVAPEFVFGPFEVDDELLNPYVSAGTDFVYVVTGNYDRAQGVHLAYACGLSYGEMSVRGAGYAYVQYNEICGKATFDGRQVYEALIHEWYHNLDWALYHINQVPDPYEYVGPDWVHWEHGDWPACGTGDPNPLAWFPSIDYCEWDPDWIDCNNVASAGRCVHAGEVGGAMSWYGHVIAAHYPRTLDFIGNFCRDGRQDFGETGVDRGGPCP